MAVLKVVVALFLVSICPGWKVGAQVHHVVGGDRGWDPSSGIGSWSSGRSFNVGDKLWFTYSAAHESILELKNNGEFEACDVSNPIMMYTDGIDSISLDTEGIRYFVSSNADNCKDGLKIDVNVQPPRPKPEIQNVATSENAAMGVVAEGPSTPSGSANLIADTFVPLLIGSFICLLIGIV